MPKLGPASNISLEDTSILFDRAGQPAGTLTRPAACLSLELAYTAYTMDLTDWIGAGWSDFSLLADGELMTGEDLNGPSTPLGELTRGVRQTLTHLHVTMRDPITQYLGLKRQQDESKSACKAVVMTRRLGAYYVIGVGFMGTGKRVFDWIPNLRIKPENGYHAGFYRLTEDFLAEAGRIRFDGIARETGKPELTLGDILADLKNPRSRFRLWVCGHSQGAALTQILLDRLTADGVPASFVRGYGFASPSVLDAGRPDAAGAPVFHILNADDLVPRAGLSAHLGRCWLFTPSQTQRAFLYRDEWTAPCFQEMFRFSRQAGGTADMLLFSLAALRIVTGQSADTLRKLLSGADLSVLPEWLRPADDFGIPALQRLEAQLEEQYLAVSGESDLPEVRIGMIRSRYEIMIGRYGLIPWLHACVRTISLPHRLCANPAKEKTPAAYQYIVTECFGALRPVPDPSMPGGSWQLPARRATPKLSLSPVPWKQPVRHTADRRPAPAPALTLEQAPEGGSDDVLREARRKVLSAAKRAARLAARSSRR